MKRLIVMVGLPRSGKSTWCRSQSHPIVNGDSVRLALHGHRFVGVAEPFVAAIVELMVRALFIAGHDTVILDETNGTRSKRDRFRSKEWETVFKVIDTSKDECLLRADENGDEVIVPVIERMAKYWEPLQADELPL